MIETGLTRIELLQEVPPIVSPEQLVALGGALTELAPYMDELAEAGVETGYNIDSVSAGYFKSGIRHTAADSKTPPTVSQTIQSNPWLVKQDAYSFALQAMGSAGVGLNEIMQELAQILTEREQWYTSFLRQQEPNEFFTQLQANISAGTLPVSSVIKLRGVEVDDEALLSSPPYNNTYHPLHDDGSHHTVFEAVSGGRLHVLEPTGSRHMPVHGAHMLTGAHTAKATRTQQAEELGVEPLEYGALHRASIEQAEPCRVEPFSRLALFSTLGVGDGKNADEREDAYPIQFEYIPLD